METYSRITRFCLVCNYVTRIIDPVASRCSKFRFKSLDAGDAVARIRDIARLEAVVLDERVAERIVEVAEGDLRRAITYLQSAARLVGSGSGSGSGSSSSAVEASKHNDSDNDSNDDEEEEEEEEGMDMDSPITTSNTKQPPPGTITTSIISEIAGSIPDSTISSLLAAIHPSKTTKSTNPTNPTNPTKPSSTPPAFNFPLLASTIKTMVADGWSAGQTVTQLYARVMYDDLIASGRRNKCAGVFSEVDRRLVDGADEELVLLDLGCRLGGILGR